MNGRIIRFLSLSPYATGQRRPLILMYEIGTTDTVNHFIDSLLNDWSKVVYLYNLVHDFAEHLKNGNRIEDSKKAAVEYLNASFSPTLPILSYLQLSNRRKSTKYNYH